MNLIYSEKLTITPTTPFNFDLSCQIFANGDIEIRRYENGTFHQAIRVNDKVILCCISSVGVVDKPKLSVELKSNTNIAREEKRIAADVVRLLFNLEFNLPEFYEQTKNDAILSKITKRLYGLRSPSTQFAFEALIDSIVEQQISLKVAHAFESRIIKKWGDAVNFEDEVFYVFPTPKSLAKATQKELREVGLSERKAEYVRNAASLIVNGKLNLESLKQKESNEIIEELDKIKGVGVWTAEFTLLRGMQHLDALPADDLGLRRLIAHFYCKEKEITSGQTREIAKNWGTWKGFAAYYLIVAEIVGLEPDAI
jgi:DNA-3-methyladenine glycosylase II